MRYVLEGSEQVNGLPYYKAYPRDFIEGTIGMSFELKAAYRLVIDLIYMRGGDLPDDDRYISGQLGCSVRAWKKYREQLLNAKKIELKNGIISNFRADKELKISRTLQEKNTENVNKRWKNNDLDNTVVILTRDNTDTDTDKKKTTSSKKKTAEKYNPKFDLIWDEYPTVLKADGQTKTSKGSKWKAYQMWLQLDDELRGQCFDGVGLYAEKIYREFEQWKAGKSREPPFVCHVTTFINERRWESYLEEDKNDRRLQQNSGLFS